jgi:hypothetical protein
MMGTVPITLTSTLDPLYSQFPCIILKSWGDLFKQNALQQFKDQVSMTGFLFVSVVFVYQSTLSIRSWQSLASSLSVEKSGIN